MGLYSNNEDPVTLFKQGKISEYKLQSRLEKITPEELGSYDTKSWSRFLIEINEIHHKRFEGT